SVTSRVLYAAAADPRTLPPFPTRRSSDLQASMTSHDNSNAGQRGMAHFVRNPAPRRLGMAAAGVWAAGLLLSGCSYVSDELWPSLTGEAPAGSPPAPMAQQIPASPAEANPQPTLSPPTMGSPNCGVPRVTPG